MESIMRILCTKNIILKLLSVILGIAVWLMISSLFKTEVWVELPVCFYNAPDAATINAPETISVKLCGYKNMLNKIRHDKPALHINAQQLHEGLNPLIIGTENLFLPETISVVDYSPIKSFIEYTEDRNESSSSCM